MSYCQVLDSNIFSKLPDSIIFYICVFTGKFKLRFNKQLCKINLVSIIDLNDKLWVRFNKKITYFVNKKLTCLKNPRETRVIVNINRFGHISNRIFIPIQLPDNLHSDNS